MGTPPTVWDGDVYRDLLLAMYEETKPSRGTWLKIIERTTAAGYSFSCGAA